MIGNEKSREFAEETGVQGSILAVTLFLKKAYQEAFVGASVKLVKKKLIQAVSWVAKWASSAGFQLSPSKSKFTHICGHNYRISKTPIYIDDKRIPKRKTIRILGVTIDRKLSFNQHCDGVKRDCLSRINLLKCIAGRHANANRDVRMNVCNAFVNSRLTYGLELTILGIRTLLDKFAPTYHRAIRTTSGLLPSTPADAACAEGGKLPFRFYIKNTICHRLIGFANRTAGSDREGFLLVEANRLHRETIDLELPHISKIHWCGTRDWNRTPMEIDSTVKSKHKAGSNPAAIRKTVVELLRTKYANHTVRYSDGSLALGRKRLPHISPPATLQSDHPIAVLTDSASVVAALESERPMHPGIQQIFEDARPDTAFVWIPGHSGIPGNEKADQLSGSGRLMEFYTKRVPADDIKAWTTKMLKDRWAKEWYTTGQDNSRVYVLRKIKADIKKWEDPRGHRDQQVVSRLRTGHTAFAYNMSRGDFKSTKIRGLLMTSLEASGAPLETMSRSYS
ncbi:uncharacterized protein LOC129761577 [Toxorhynchites rutilus septentrionalis]|uniref:uncharacterized protein LOC129761577 n=1 Tax=Toxorhynchites rutilus septentrionalis TaxID=329112 RepID=UPI00247A73E2|nr:uncharacterized protein LOC129761577 [Toxorhynchites rutilus septentrionalis]